MQQAEEKPRIRAGRAASAGKPASRSPATASSEPISQGKGR
ncbi:hypothetical protein [Belnapia mucosa]|nr:hypothetical protein [Belnapia mucosa]